MTVLNKTEEQIKCIEACRKHKKVKINARAGAAKTTTLCMIAEDNPVKSLMLVFNKAAKEDAEDRVPSHVEVRTVHSLAYKHVGYKYRSKLSRPKGKYLNVAQSGAEVAEFFNIDPIKGTHKELKSSHIGVLVKRIVDRFEQSSLDGISGYLYCVNDIAQDFGVDVDKLTATLYTYAQKLWEKRSDLSSRVMATHDTYMKLFQLSKPKLDYDIVYIDEGQDVSECMLDIIMNQDNKVVLVGDSHQKIYGWRGAVDAMKLLDWHEVELTNSFRFGKSVAKLSTSIIGKQVKSMSSEDTLVGECVVDRTKPYTRIYRTNAQLISDAVNDILKGVTVKLEVDTYEFIRLLQSGIELFNGNISKVKHEDLVGFSSWDDLLNEAEHDPQLSRLSKLIESRACFKILKALRGHNNAQKDPHVTYVTAHKSKGREWDQVIVADDFVFEGEEGLSTNDSEELTNLIYVAVTRAKKALEISNTLSGLKCDAPEVGINLMSGGSVDQIEEFVDGVAAKALTKHNIQFETKYLPNLSTKGLLYGKVVLNDLVDVSV